MKKKILLLDGIGGVPLGREIHEAFCNAGVDAGYLDLADLPKKHFYGLRSAFWKAVNKRLDYDGYYHFPRVPDVVITNYIAQERPDVILVIGFSYKFINPSVLEHLKKEFGFSLCLYDTDSCNLYSRRREFIFFIEEELSVYDEIFSFSKVAAKLFRDTRQLNATFLPFGARPIQLSSVPQQDIDVLFVGSGDLRRILLLESVKDKVTVYGARWSRNLPLMSGELRSKVQDVSVWGADLHNLLMRSKIVLNITRTDFYGAETGINLRIFEALAAGCFLLTDYCDELAELFEAGKEIETFCSSAELADKVAYYLAHEDERITIARQGHEKFLRLHTWDKRVGELVGKMGLV